MTDQTLDGKARTRKILLAILLLAFAARVSTMLLLQTWEFPSDLAFGNEEGEIAYSLANGDGFAWPVLGRAVGPPGNTIQPEQPVPTSWKAPVNPVIVAAAFWIFGSYTVSAAVALELFQIVLSILSCYVLFRLGKLVFNSDWPGLLAALIFAFYPASIHFSVQKIEYGTLLTLLGLLILQQTLELAKRTTVSRSLVLGLLCGLATLVNPVIIAFYPFALLWFLGRHEIALRFRLWRSVTIMACCAAVMTPWLIRNYVVFDQFVFIRSNFAREVLAGNFSSRARSAMGIDLPDLVEIESEPSTSLGSQVVGLLREYPERFLMRTRNRVVRFWTQLGASSSSFERFVAGAAYFPILVLGIVGAWFARRERLAHLLILYVVTSPLPFYLTWSDRGRFRFPIEPVLMLLASYALAKVLVQLSGPISGGNDRWKQLSSIFQSGS